jgi:hypothetical protein
VDYGTVASSAFSTDTTVTLIANDDYTIANATLSAPRYSYAENPQGFPHYFNWTLNFSVSGGTAPTYTFFDKAQFSIQGNTLHWQIVRQNASGGTAGAGTAAIFFDLPVQLNSDLQRDNRTVLGFGYSSESGGTAKNVVVQYNDNGNGEGYFVSYDRSTITGNDQSSTAREITANGSYRI